MIPSKSKRRVIFHLAFIYGTAEKLHSDAEVRMLFTPSPLAAYRSARIFKSFFTRSKVYPLERTMALSKPGSKRCQVCLSVSETDTFESFQTKRQYEIYHHLNYYDKCLIYLLSYKTCGLQYVSSTMTGKHSVVKITCNQNYLSISSQRNIMGFYKITV